MVTTALRKLSICCFNSLCFGISIKANSDICIIVGVLQRTFNAILIELWRGCQLGFVAKYISFALSTEGTGRKAFISAGIIS
jgi:hypothetical protein